MGSPADLQPRRVLIAGDTHGEASAIDYPTSVASTEDAPVRCELGDFGYWPHQHDGARFLQASERLASLRDVLIVFIDGNQENFDHLRRLERTAGGFAPVSDHIFYAPRGLRWTWCDVGFLAVGGASSVDKEWRLALERARQGASAPAVALQDLCDSEYILHPETLENRRRLRQVVDATHPAAIFHGHYHVFHKRPYFDTERGLEIACTGLDMQGSGAESWRTLDLETFRDVYRRRSSTGSSG